MTDERPEHWWLEDGPVPDHMWRFDPPYSERMRCERCGLVTTYATLRRQDFGGMVAPCHD